MPLDASIYSNQTNPLTQVGDLVNIAGGVQRNQLLATENKRQQLELAKAHIETVNKAFGAALADGTRDGFLGMATQLWQNGVIPSVDAASEIAKLPPESAFKNPDGSRISPEAERAIMTQHLLPYAMYGASAEQQIDQALGNITGTATGQGTKFTRQSPVLGVRNMAGQSIDSLPQSINTAGVDAQGNPVPGTQLVNNVSGGASPQQSITARNPGANVPAPAPTTPPMSGQGAAINKPAPPGASPDINVAANNVQNNGQYPFVPSQVAPAVQKTSEGSAQALNDTYGNDAGFNGRQFQLEQAITALKGAQTGKGTQGIQDVKSILLSLGPKQLSQLKDPDTGETLTTKMVEEVASRDKAQKYLTQYALGFPGAGRSDQGLMTALTGNASVNINNMAASDVAKYTLGMERMNHQMVQDFSKSGKPASDFNAWRTQNLNSYEPSAYAADQFTPAQLKKYTSSLTSGELAKWKLNYNNGVAGGTIEHKYGQ